MASRVGFTLVELLVVVTIVAILATMAVSRMRDATVKTQLTQAKQHLRQMSEGLEMYRADYGTYPEGRSRGLEDPLGILTGTALSDLTSPVPYVSAGAFHDPFGPTRKPGSEDALDPRFPDINPEQYLLYFSYTKLARVRRDPSMAIDGFAAVSIGPDHQDSLVVYYPFPGSLPPAARLMGIDTVEETVYDPTNGVRSRGDIARFGGEAAWRGCCFGGDS